MANEPESQKSIQQNFWVVVPAAGVGKRMQADCPKQYLPLADKTLLEVTLTRLLAHPQIQGLVVAVAPEDQYWVSLEYAKDSRVLTVEGGNERCHSVLNGLKKLDGIVPAQDWVMVHDVARPCISREDLDLLIEASASAQDGLVLGVPTRDTMKQVDQSNQIVATAERSELWHAFTPQMFRLGDLDAAISGCLRNNVLVTDEASAMEQSGYNPQMVQGNEHNIKVTRPKDLLMAEWILQAQEES